MGVRQISVSDREASKNRDFGLEFVYPVIKKIPKMLVIKWLQLYLIERLLIVDRESKLQCGLRTLSRQSIKSHLLCDAEII